MLDKTTYRHHHLCVLAVEIVLNHFEIDPIQYFEITFIRKYNN